MLFKKWNINLSLSPPTGVRAEIVHNFAFLLRFIFDVYYKTIVKAGKYCHTWNVLDSWINILLSCY